MMAMIKSPKITRKMGSKLPLQIPNLTDPLRMPTKGHGYCLPNVKIEARAI